MAKTISQRADDLVYKLLGETVESSMPSKRFLTFDDRAAHQKLEAAQEAMLARFGKPYVAQAKALLDFLRQQVPIEQITVGMGGYVIRVKDGVTIPVLEDDEPTPVNRPADKVINRYDDISGIQWPPDYIQALGTLKNLMEFLSDHNVVGADIT